MEVIVIVGFSNLQCKEQLVWYHSYDFPELLPGGREREKERDEKKKKPVPVSSIIFIPARIKAK
jgi:hypothetical protein